MIGGVLSPIKVGNYKPQEDRERTNITYSLKTFHPCSQVRNTYVVAPLQTLEGNNKSHTPHYYHDYYCICENMLSVCAIGQHNLIFIDSTRHSV